MKDLLSEFMRSDLKIPGHSHFVLSEEAKETWYSLS